MRTRLLAVCSLLFLLIAARVETQCSIDFILVSIWDDFSSNLSTLDPVTKTGTSYVDTTLSPATLRAFGSRAYALNRTDGHIQILDPCSDFSTIATFPAGIGMRDLVFVSPTVGYVTRYFGTSLLKIDENGTAIGTVDLSMFADADGEPEMDQMFLYAGRLYICLQRTNFGAPSGSSLLAVLDVATGTLVDMDPVVGGIQGIGLLLSTPVSEVNLRVHGGVHKAYFSAVGAAGVLDGGVIECVASDPSQQSVILTESNAGGDVIDVEIVSDTKGFAIVSALPNMELVAFNPSTGLKIGTAMLSVPLPNYQLTDIEPSSLGLLLSYHTQIAPPGIRCFDMTTNIEIPGGPIDVGWAPWDILVQEGPTGVGDTPAVTKLGQNYPNPFNPETSIPFTVASAGHVSLTIYDVSGALVVTLVDEHREAGEHVARWDGRDTQGETAPTGVYFARLQTAGETVERKLVLLK